MNEKALESPQEFDFQKELKKMEDMLGMEGFGQAMNEIANMIHPDMSKMATLTASLKSIQDINEVIELSDELNDKLCNIQIDLYTLIKDIHKEKKMPGASLDALERLLKGPSMVF